MARKARTFGLILVAISALAAAIAPVASAEIFALKSEAEKTTLKGEQEGATKIVVDGGTISCETAKLSGEMSGEYAFEVTLTPTYEKCQMGGITAEVQMNGCDYLTTTVAVESTNYEVETRIKCEVGKTISIISKAFGVTKCTINIGAQEGLQSITATVAGTPSAIRTSFTLSGVKYDQVAGTGLGACATAKGTTNGTYQGVEVLKGFSGETQVKMQAQALLQAIDISKNPIKLAGKKSTATFDIISKAAEPLTITNLVIDGTVVHKAKCINQALAKNGDKCTEEIECVAPLGEKPWLGVVVGPPGGARVRLEGC